MPDAWHAPRRNAFSVRPYRNDADLRLMQDLLVRDFAHTETRIGDLAWRSRTHGHFERCREITLWFAEDELVAYVWCRSNGGCDLYVAAKRRDDEDLWRRMFARAEAIGTDRRLAGDRSDELYLWFASELPVVEPLLEAHGYRRDDADGGGQLLIHDDLYSVPTMLLPGGYSFGWTDESSVHARVELHRAAFSPSELTVGAYHRVRATWPYEPALDRVVRDASGRIVAACIAWMDRINHAGLIEPVAVHPDFQNGGLGRAIVGDALNALRAEGARSAQVGTSGPAAEKAYRAVGFEPWKRERTFRRRLADSR